MGATTRSNGLRARGENVMFELITYDVKRGLWLRDGLRYGTRRVADRQATRLTRMGTEVRVQAAQPITSRLVMA